MSKTVFISTLDNPYDPADDFHNWYAYDLRKGYDTLGLLGRISAPSSNLPPNLQQEETERAIDEIVKENVSGIYVKIVKDN